MALLCLDGCVRCTEMCVRAHVWVPYAWNQWVLILHSYLIKLTTQFDSTQTLHMTSFIISSPPWPPITSSSGGLLCHGLSISISPLAPKFSPIFTFFSIYWHWTISALVPQALTDDGSLWTIIWSTGTRWNASLGGPRSFPSNMVSSPPTSLRRKSTILLVCPPFSHFLWAVAYCQQFFNVPVTGSHLVTMR